jgi:hypothetical protein
MTEQAELVDGKESEQSEGARSEAVERLPQAIQQQNYEPIQ